MTMVVNNHRNGSKKSRLLVWGIGVSVAFSLLTVTLLRTSCIGESRIDIASLNMASVLQAAFAGAAWSSSSAQGPVLTERGAIATRTAAVEDLISSLRDTTQTAARGEYHLMDLTGEERERWTREHPCKSRTELRAMYKRRLWAGDVQEDDGLWDAVLEEYSKLHRVCLRRVGAPQRLRPFFEDRKDIPGCKFAIADSSEGGGLGNKILSIVDTILYAVLTQRVVLVSSSTLIPELMCEPFVGSSWVLDSNAFPLPPWNFGQYWPSHKEVYRELDRNPRAVSGTRPRSKFYASSMEEYQYQPDVRFFCDTEQENFKGVKWLYFTGCLYSIPKLFAIPMFRTILEELFPSRLVLTRTLRSVMLPNDVVWDRIVAAEEQHLKGADRRVGLQIRFRFQMDEYMRMNTIVNDRIMQCGTDNEFLPRILESGTVYLEHQSRGNASSDSNNTNFKVTVFVASLFAGFKDFANEQYVPKAKSNGEDVKVVQLSNEESQAYGLEVDRQALTEILMLSFCDHIVVSPRSTFGGVAQAYGNLLPWILEFRTDSTSRVPCQRGQTVDVCYQEADQAYDCPYNPLVDKRRIFDEVPYLRKCLAADTANGVQLITKNSRDSLRTSLSLSFSFDDDGG